MTSSKGLMVLESDDFKFVDVPGGDGKQPKTQMRLAIEGEYSLVLFYTNECDKCNRVKPELMKMVGNPRVQICVVNVYHKSSDDLIGKSLKTTTPLQYVPFVVFYVKGFPFKVYNEEGGDLAGFVFKSIEEASKTFDFSDAIPSYSIGKPVASKVCYLTYSKAY